MFFPAINWRSLSKRFSGATLLATFFLLACGGCEINTPTFSDSSTGGMFVGKRFVLLEPFVVSAEDQIASPVARRSELPPGPQDTVLPTGTELTVVQVEVVQWHEWLWGGPSARTAAVVSGGPHAGVPFIVYGSWIDGFDHQIHPDNMTETADSPATAPARRSSPVGTSASRATRLSQIEPSPIAQSP
jgi:hypothetical protein